MRVIFFLLLSLFFYAPSFAEEGPQVAKDGYTASAVCGKCHAQMYSRWKDSIHAHAYDDPIFDAAYNIAYRKTGGEAKKVCLPCHAPTVGFTGDFDEKLPITKEGVTCDFCHTVKEVDLKAKDPYIKAVGWVKWGPLKEGKGLEGKHDIAYSPVHKKAEFCAGCHEFISKNGVSVIGTFTEWKEGPYPAKGTQCQDCHMPMVEGKIVESKDAPVRLINEHNLMGGHSLMQLKKAVTVKIVDVNASEARTEVMVDIANAGSGHRVPTGIPTRRLVLNVEVESEGAVITRDKIVYEKVLSDLEGKELTHESDIMMGGSMQITKDNRIKPGETRREVFTFYVPGSKVKKVEAWVEYAYNPLILERASMRLEMARDGKTVR